MRILGYVFTCNAEISSLFCQLYRLGIQSESTMLVWQNLGVFNSATCIVAQHYITNTLFYADDDYPDDDDDDDGDAGGYEVAVDTRDVPAEQETGH